MKKLRNSIFILIKRFLDRRLHHVETVFDALDQEGLGYLNPCEVAKHICDKILYEMYLCNGGREDMLQSFFELFLTETDGKITREEWLAFYTDMSSQVSSDEVFVKHLERMWNVLERDVNTIPEYYVRGV